MKTDAINYVNMVFRQKPLMKQYGRRLVIILAPIGSNITADHHVFDILSSINIADKVAVENAFSVLGFDFGVIVVSGKKVFLGCGPRSLIKLFFQINGLGIIVRDYLPVENAVIDRANALNIDAIISLIGSSMATGAFEIRRTTACIDKNWHCVPNSQTLSIDIIDRTFSGYAFDSIWNNFSCSGIGIGDAIQEARRTLQSATKKFSTLGGVCVETSGGVDSGIVLATAKSVLDGGFRCGISCEYPFFEFQREQKFRRDLYNHLRAEAHYEAADNTIPFARCNLVPGHDSPSIGSLSWSFFNTNCRSAAFQGASILLTGHGGDRIFLQNPFKRNELRLSNVPAWPKWFPRRLYAASVIEAEDIHSHLYSLTANGICGEWNGAMFEPGWNERYGAIGTGVTRYCSGFLDRDFVRSMAYVWSATRQLDMNVRKPIAHLVFPDSLPRSIWYRPSKVNHLGTIYRGARIWKNELLDITERASPVLDAMGISRKDFFGAIKNAGDGHDCANEYIGFVLSVLIWAAADLHSALDHDQPSEIGVDLSTMCLTLPAKNVSLSKLL